MRGMVIPRYTPNRVPPVANWNPGTFKTVFVRSQCVNSFERDVALGITYCDQARREEDRTQHSNKLHLLAIPLRSSGNTRLRSKWRNIMYRVRVEKLPLL
jgi:hypothetical protein